MTNLLSEFLIEPAYRHARRLSRCDSLSSTASDEHSQFYTDLTASSSQSSLALQDNSIIDFTFWGADEADNLGVHARAEAESGILTTLTSLISGPRRLSGGPFVYPSTTSQSSDIAIAQASRRTLSEDEPRLVRVQPRPPPPIVTPLRVDERVVIDEPAPSLGSAMSAIEAETTRNEAPASTVKQNILPADDGMFLLRGRIRQIQQSKASVEDKARQMLEVMTEDYKKKHRANRGELSPSDGLSERTTSPSAASFDDRRPLTPTSLASTDTEFRYNLTPADCIPTFVPQKPTPATTPLTPAPSQEDHELAPALGCQHYKRNVKLQCSTCHKWYTCRFCHDEVETHELIRKETQNMLCMFCWKPQPAGKACSGCHKSTACYYCDICKLWDDDGRKEIYHCQDCGICRKGAGLGKDFFHCKTCAACMAIKIAGSHRCIERSTDCDCPICGDYMFTSPQTVVFMLCGHSIHKKCYYEHMKTSYKCPICSRSIANMESQFRNLDHTIAAQPMPTQFQGTRALISCNDCCVKSVVNYHWLGLKCAECHSYNTSLIQVVRNEESTGTGTTPRPLAIDTTIADSATYRNTSPRNASPLQGGPQHFTPPSSHPGVEDGATGAMRRMEMYLAQGVVAEAEARTRHMAAAEGEVPSEDEEEEDDCEEEEESFWGGTDPREKHTRSNGSGSGNGRQSSRSASRVPESPTASHDDDVEEEWDDTDDDMDEIDVFGHP